MCLGLILFLLADIEVSIIIVMEMITIMMMMIALNNIIIWNPGLAKLQLHWGADDRACPGRSIAIVIVSIVVIINIVISIAIVSIIPIIVILLPFLLRLPML